MNRLPIEGAHRRVVIQLTVEVTRHERGDTEAR